MKYEFQNQLPIAFQLFEMLRVDIVEMRLRPGEALSEKDFAARFGVSRQPVREAFIKLSDAGLVEIRPSRGTYVSKILVSDVADSRYVREAVECCIVRDAAHFATSADCELLYQMIADQQRASSANDSTAFHLSDEKFHRAISDIVECEYARKTIERARYQIDRVRYMSLDSVTPLELLIEQHTQIVDCISKADEDGAVAAMQLHLREILISLPALAEKYPDVFDCTVFPVHAQRTLKEMNVGR